YIAGEYVEAHVVHGGGAGVRMSHVSEPNRGHAGRCLASHGHLLVIVVDLPSGREGRVTRAVLPHAAGGPGSVRCPLWTRTATGRPGRSRRTGWSAADPAAPWSRSDSTCRSRR